MVGKDAKVQPESGLWHSKRYLNGSYILSNVLLERLATWRVSNLEILSLFH